MRNYYPVGLGKRTVNKMLERVVAIVEKLMDRDWAPSRPQLGGK